MVNELPFILVIDDQEAARYGIKRILEHAGFSVLEGATGKECLRLSHEHKPDAVILDVRLPDLDGFEVCRKIKTTPETASTAVLMVSAELMESEHKAAGLDCGADIYLPKPLSPKELVSTVKALLRTHKAEHMAQSQAHQWNVTFDAMSSGIALLDAGGRIRQCNGAMARLLGREIPTAIGEDLFTLLQRATGFDGRKNWDGMKQAQRRQSAEFLMNEHWLSIDFEPIAGDQAQPLDAVCILSNITDRKKAEAELRAANQMLIEADQRKNYLLAMVAHELRGPLAPIRYALQILDKVDPKDKIVRRQREIIDRQLSYMSRQLEDLLDITRIREGNFSLNKEILDLQQIVDQVVEALQPEMEAHRQEFIHTPSAAPIWIEGDRVRLEQIVRNLLGNAIKFTQLGGRIELMLERKDPPDPAMGAWGLLRIRDNGIGIAPEMQPHVFDPFTQAHHSIVRTQGGLGLGLAMVRSLVQMHGGQVTALSEGVGCGSEFIVRLPLCTGPAPSVTPLPSEEAQEPATKQKREGLKILIVDNNRDAVEGLQELLTLWGHEAKGVYSGLEAIVESPVFQPDMILMDIGLPGMNGFEACRRLHQEPSLEGVVIIAVTGYGREEDRSMAAESGFSHFLIKPVELGRLRQIIAEVIASRG